MVKITISKNEENQRLDRFLRKYFAGAALSHIYQLIRKEVRLNGKRASISQILKAGDELSLNISPEQEAEYRITRKKTSVRKQFTIAYEDQQTLIVIKPFGLLTHGNTHEKINTLTNQVCGYLQEQGAYDPSREKTFAPSPVNRLDRNTTGLVIFGKTLPALQNLNQMIRQRDCLQKYYLTVVRGQLSQSLQMTDRVEKNERENYVKVLSTKRPEGKAAESIVRPVETRRGYTLVEVQLITGRTHQIRAQLAKRGFPLIGDPKYGNQAINRGLRERLGLHTQLLHAWKLEFEKTTEFLESLMGKTIVAELPKEFQRIKSILLD